MAQHKRQADPMSTLPEHLRVLKIDAHGSHHYGGFMAWRLQRAEWLGCRVDDDPGPFLTDPPVCPCGVCVAGRKRIEENTASGVWKRCRAGSIWAARCVDDEGRCHPLIGQPDCEVCWP